MRLRVTIDMFSGQENPVVELSEAESKAALKRLKPARPLRRGEPKTTPPKLGYRGLIVDQVAGRSTTLPRSFSIAEGRLLGPDLAHLATDPEFEDHILSTQMLTKRFRLPRRTNAVLLQEKLDFRGWLEKTEGLRGKLKLQRKGCPCAPIYEPAWWNDGGQKQLQNNCYNYSTNYRTDTFAQPGRAAGATYTSLTCGAVRPAAIADDLIDQPKANNRCPTGRQKGHLVALVVAPGFDYHWYRLGANGFWSHKPGRTPVTNLDNSGHVITDPRTADRGPYTDFCTFMLVMHGHIKIQ